MAPIVLDPLKIPPEVEVKAGLQNNRGRHTITGPDKIVSLDLNPYRKGKRLQEPSFELARDLTRDYVKQSECQAPAHVLFPQVVVIVQRYLNEKVKPIAPADRLDIFLSPYYGWVVERLAEAIQPDAAEGEPAELPRLESNRAPGTTAEVDLKGNPPWYLVLETKGFDDLADIKAQAAQRWVNAVNADGRFGMWAYAMARKPEEVAAKISEA